MVLEDGSVRFIICWISIYKPVDCNAIEGKAPVRGRRMKSVVLPFTPVVSGAYCCFVLVQIVADVIWMPSQGGTDTHGGKQ